MIGATNRPFDLDEAALRRLTKRVYISLPDAEARLGTIIRQLKDVKYKLTKSDQRELAICTEGFSFADLNALVKDAAMGPIRDLQGNQQQIVNLKKS